MTRSGSVESSKQWDIHEHVATSVEIEAKKLLDAAGNAEIAKQAVDAVAESNSVLADPQALFAESLGFQSYRALVESSTPAKLTGERQWYVTSTRGNEWALWSDRDLTVTGLFDSRESALRAAW